jgi:hypothetical protein
MNVDYTLDDIIREVQQELPIKLPKKIIKVFIKHTLRKMFIVLNRNPNNSIAMTDSSIARFYHRIDFVALEKAFMDVDETKPDKKRIITQGYLKVLDAKRSPRLRVRGKRDRTIIYHKGVNLS